MSGREFIRMILGPLGLPPNTQRVVIEADCRNTAPLLKVYAVVIPDRDAATVIAGALPGQAEVVAVADVVISERGEVTVKGDSPDGVERKLFESLDVMSRIETRPGPLL